MISAIRLPRASIVDLGSVGCGDGGVVPPVPVETLPDPSSPLLDESLSKIFSNLPKIDLNLFTSATLIIEVFDPISRCLITCNSCAVSDGRINEYAPRPTPASPRPTPSLPPPLGKDALPAPPGAALPPPATPLAPNRSIAPPATVLMISGIIEPTVIAAY